MLRGQVGIFVGKDRKIGNFGFMKKQRYIHFRQNQKYFILLSSTVCCTTMIRKEDDSALLMSLFRQKFGKKLPDNRTIKKHHFDSKKCPETLFCVVSGVGQLATLYQVLQKYLNQLIVHQHTAIHCNLLLDVRSVYVDISEVLDRVWQAGLLSGQFLKLIQSFLTDLMQQTVLNAKASTWGKLSAGVPQVSILQYLPKVPGTLSNNYEKL